MQGAGEKPGEKLIATLGHADADLPLRAAVKLGWAPGPRALPTSQASVRYAEQSSLDEAIEVEGGETSADGFGRRSFVPRDIVVLPGHVGIDGATLRIAQRVDGLDVRVDLGGWHSNNNSNWF